jgi:bacillopeptidase F (M6 metalloprotease family)
VVDTNNLSSSTKTGGWVTHSVNLSAYAGQSVTRQIRAETDSSNKSNLFVDDVTFQATPLAVGGTDGIAPNLEVSTTQGKLGILPQTENPQGVKEERLLNPMTQPR